MRLRHHLVLPLLAASALLGAPSLQAQELPPPGSRVRIVAPLAPAATPVRVTGTLLSATRDSLSLSTLDGSGPLLLERRSVRTVEISRGRRRVLWGVLGATAGFFVGGTVGGLLGGRGEPEGSLGGLVGLTAGVVIGVPVGAVGGAVLAPERWRHYPDD